MAEAKKPIPAYDVQRLIGCLKEADVVAGILGSNSPESGRQPNNPLPELYHHHLPMAIAAHNFDQCLKGQVPRIATPTLKLKDSMQTRK